MLQSAWNEQRKRNWRENWRGRKKKRGIENGRISISAFCKNHLKEDWRVCSFAKALGNCLSSSAVMKSSFENELRDWFWMLVLLCQFGWISHTLYICTHMYIQRKPSQNPIIHPKIQVKSFQGNEGICQKLHFPSKSIFNSFLQKSKYYFFVLNL